MKNVGAKKKKVWSWVAVSGLIVVCLIGSLLFFADKYLSSAEVKKQIQKVVVDSTGGILDYGAIEINLLPTPTIKLQTVHYTIPDTVDGKIGVLRFTPQLTSLLVGNIQIAQLILETPVVHLNISENKDNKENKEDNSAQKEIAVTDSNIDVSAVLDSVRKLAPNISLKIAGGNFTVVDEGFQLEVTGMNSEVSCSIDNAQAGDAHIVSDIGEIRVKYGKSEDQLKGFNFESNYKIKNDRVVMELKQLSLVSPALVLDGEAGMTTALDDISLDFNGTEIDVDATRKTALRFGGGNEVVEAIFRYLIGGNVTTINYSAKVKTFSELGDWDKFSITASLENGAVSIPEIEMKLTEVNGEVSIVDGLLSATDATTQLKGSSGRSGMLKLGLAEGNDLFELKIILNANLAEVQTVLAGIVKNTSFEKELHKVTHLKGTASGTLVLGDSLGNIRVGVENSEINLSFEYQPVPYPIIIENGHVALTEKKIHLTDVTGKIGKSDFTNLNCMLNWQDGFALELDTGQSNLVLNELYPWLSSINKNQKIADEFKKVSGALNLTSAQFKGLLGKPTKWQYSASGAIDGVTVATTYYPSDIQIKNGTFHLDQKQIKVEKTSVRAGDGALMIDGTVTDIFSEKGQKVSVLIDGTLGAKSVTALEDIFGFPEVYHLKTPISLSKNKVSWQAGGPTLLVGNISIENGPHIDIDLNYSSEKLKVNKLTVKDNQSDSTMTLVLGQDGFGGSFNGLLNSQSINNIFVKTSYRVGEIVGDVSINLPDTTQTKGVASGNLKGTNLEIPLSTDDSVKIKEVLLKGEGSAVGVDISELVWKKLTLAPVNGVATFNEDNVVIKIDKAALCGIDAPGTITVVGDEYTLDFDLSATELDIATSYYCLSQGRVRMTGQMDFTSQVSTSGKKGDLLDALEGPLHIAFHNGIIQQAKGISRLLEVLNVTTLVKGHLPDLTITGLEYSTFDIDGHFGEGKFIIDKLYMDGETLDILGQGEIDITNQTLNIQLLASPFTNIDTIIKHIPGLNYIMSDRLVAIPVSIKGTIDDPHVSAMSLSSVSNSLMNFGERTLKMPFKLIEAIIPNGSDEKK